MISGYTVDHDLLQEMGRGASVEGVFVTDKHVAATTLPALASTPIVHATAAASNAAPFAMSVEGKHFLAVSRDLSPSANVPLRLVLLKSLAPAERTERDISQLLILAGLLAMGIGSVLMLLLAQTLTTPVERLASAVSAFAEGDEAYALPDRGPREVRYLSAAIADMRADLQKKNRALLESERLATIGRMAHSVSHDLRHYLAAVYGNAEFLASPSLPAHERNEVFEEIRAAVAGTTDMLDALLLFGSTGSAPTRWPVPMSAIVEQAVALVRAHPDASSVTVKTNHGDVDAFATMDRGQMERAVYNLLLNAAQSAAEGTKPRVVAISVEHDQTTVSVTVSDTGPGVPDAVRHTLFDAFVSVGKQKGTGLGLTLAHRVAQEHNGGVTLIRSVPGETLFRLTIERSYPPHQDEQLPSASLKVLK